MFLDSLRQDLRTRIRPYEPLQNGDVEGPVKPRAHWRQLVPRGRRGLTFALIITFVVVFALIFKRPANINIKSFKRQKHSFETTAGYLHIIIPAGDPNPNFCRTALSAALLNQPHPYVANWGGQFNDNRYGEEGKWEWGNLAGTLQYLKDLPPARADDLVLVIDHEDTWFQLQPELLIKRYRDVIRLSQRQLRGRLGNAAEEGLKQKIVFAAQKTCPNNNENHISCYAPPEPPPPSSSYRYSSPLDKNGVQDTRPRYLNSGMIMGPVSSVLDAYQAAYTRWEHAPTSFTTRQSLFATLFGEQEYSREILRISHLSPLSRLRNWMFGSTTFLHGRPPPQAILQPSNNTTPEHGIALDYTSLLSHVAQDAEDDASYIRFSSLPSLTSSALNITFSLPRKTLARDITYSRPPFFSLAPFSSAYPFEYEDLPREIPWANMHLYTNLQTSNTPPLILNFNHRPLAEAFLRPSEEELSARWRSLWFHPHTRKKLVNRAYEPTYAIASESFPSPPSPHSYAGTNPKYPPVKEESAVMKNWWAPIYVSPINKQREGIGFLIDTEEGKGKDGWMKWGDVCAEGVQERAFGDGKGRWRDVQVYPPFGDLEGGQGGVLIEC